MRYPLSHFFNQRENTFSNFWLKIVQTRFVLCLILVVSSIFIQEMPKKTIILGTFVYFVINITFGFFSQSQLQQKRFRIIPAIIDVIFASFLIHFTNGQNSPWFLLYVFPIVSVSRYLSYQGSVPLAVFSIFGYLASIFIPTTSNAQSLDLYSLAIKTLTLLGIGFVSGNLTKIKHREDESLIKTFTEIDEAILNNSKLDDVLKLIVEKAVEFAKADFGQIKILEETEVIKSVSFSKNKDSEIINPEIDFISNNFRKKVLDLKKNISVHFKKAKKKNGVTLPQDVEEKSTSVFITSIAKTKNFSGCGLFVPLIIDEKIRGILEIYSNDQLHHFSSNKIDKLSNFAPLLGITLKNFYLENEKKERLKMLFEIGGQLAIDKNLQEIFQKVVSLTHTRLRSEDSALFIWNEEKELIEKVAVQGPSEEITKKLQTIENPYKKGESLVGKIFEKKEPKFLNTIESSVEYKEEYSRTLPSKNTEHYIGVPLVIGNEVLGVLRVINKRSQDYSIENNNFTLSEEGFRKDDLELMQILASQVASVIRSAKFIEISGYYEALVENSPDPIIVLDEDGKIKVFNVACEKIWGVDSKDAIGSSIESYYASDEHAKEIGKLLWQSPNYRVQGFQVRIKNSKQEIIPMSLSASFLFDKNRKRIGSIGVFKDLRETLKLQAEKTTAEKLASLGKLSHTVGHEIKHDIATALNYIDVLAYECSDEELSEIYQDIKDSLGEAVDKFQNMLMVGKPKPPQKQFIGSYDIFRLVEEKARRRAISEDIELIINYPSDDDDLEADIEQLKQVFMNIFNNSVDAIKMNKSKEEAIQKGKIEMTGISNNEVLHIVWQDNGCGIPSKDLPKVFLPFETSKETGNGLGLFNVKSIVENHDGIITLESEEGKGTTITFVLPILVSNN